ncbi:hypothetical protein OQA88_9309 [Cercophora sp. LCS_1]
MTKWLYPLAFAAVAYTEVLDIGDVKQLDPKIDALPEGLQADSIWINPAEGGFNIVLGQDLKAKVDGVLEGCGQLDNQCYQDVVKVLQDGSIQMDKRLESRQWLVTAGTIAKVLQTGVKIVEGIGAIVVAVFAVIKGPGDDKGQFWPDVVASAVGKLPDDALITVSAGDSAVVTITQAPNPTASLEGSVTPIVTAATAAADGFEKGDLAGILDKDLAARLGGFMARTKECQVGNDFDKQAYISVSHLWVRRVCAIPGNVVDADI